MFSKFEKDANDIELLNIAFKFVEGFLPDLQSSIAHQSDRHKRSTPSKSLTIELAVFTDSEFTKLLPSASLWKRLELMLLKYNGVTTSKFTGGRFIIICIFIYSNNPPYLLPTTTWIIDFSNPSFFININKWSTSMNKRIIEINDLTIYSKVVFYVKAYCGS